MLLPLQLHMPSIFLYDTATSLLNTLLTGFFMIFLLLIPFTILSVLFLSVLLLFLLLLFQQGNELYNSHTSLLNSLGFCYYKMGDFENALEVLKASLALNPAQEEVKARISEIEKK